VRLCDDRRWRGSRGHLFVIWGDRSRLRTGSMRNHGFVHWRQLDLDSLSTLTIHRWLLVQTLTWQPLDHAIAFARIAMP
jgi:hypothetical protein